MTSRAFPLALALICGVNLTATAIAAGNPDHTGALPDAGSRVAASSVTQLACRALWYRLGLGDETERFASYGLNITFASSPAELGRADLSQYDLLIISQACPGQLNGARIAIQNFVAQGHGLLIHQLDCPGVMDFMPPGFEITIRDYYWCDFPTSFQTHLTGVPHPIVAGLTDAQLAGAADWVGSLGTGFAVLGVNPDVGCGDPALAAGSYGTGRIVFEDGNASSNSIWPGTNAYWLNVLNWLCPGTPVPTHRPTWGEVKTLYR